MADIIKLERDQIAHLVHVVSDGPEEKDRDEMAIPSYLHGNPLIRWIVWRRHVLLARMAQFQPNMRVLDFGCGIGMFLPTLCRYAGKVLAIDLFPVYAKQLAKEHHLEVEFPNDLHEVDDGSLDLIFAAEVLEHFDDIDGIAELFAHKLSPSGKLLVSLPVEGFVYKVGRFLAGFGDKGEYHKQTAYTVIGTLKESGFTLLAKDDIPYWFFPSLSSLI